MEYMKTLSQILSMVEEKSIASRLSDDVLTFLTYLIHSKAHVMNNKSKNPNMEAVLKLCKNDVFTKPLYRGLYIETLKDFTVGKVYEFTRYQSFSEYESIAKRFSKTGLILKATKSKGGFNYGKFLVDQFEDLKKTDPRGYDAEDGDFMIEAAEEEAEHIFPMNTKFMVTVIKGKLIEGYIS